MSRLVAPPGLVLEPFTVLDGGLSTALERLGHDVAGPLWTARLVLEDPEAVIAAHGAYLAAGADVLITASYQASVEGFVRAGCRPEAARSALAGTTALAREAARRAGRSVVVAASCGPYGAVLADGSEYHGRYAVGWDEVRRFHRERLAVLADSGADVLAVETIPTRAEAEIVLDVLAAHPTLAAWVSYSCADAATTCGGDPFEAAVAAAVASPNVVAVGVNCTAPAHVEGLLRRARDVTGLPLVAYPNHGGRWDGAHDRWEGPACGLDVAHDLDRWLAVGARLVGGCCGIGPDAIAALAAAKQARRA